MASRFPSNRPVTQMSEVMDRVPVLRQLGNQHRGQLMRVLERSRLEEFCSGEVVLRRGAKDSRFYFLLTGQLAVYRDEAIGRPLNFISPGELFGDLAVLSRTMRRATVVVDEQCRKATTLSLDFADFGELEDFSFVSLTTKLIFYRAMVHASRWRLELKRMEHPEHSLVAAIRQLPNFNGPKDSAEELEFLNLQAARLASLITSWDLQHATGVDGVAEIEHQLAAS